MALSNRYYVVAAPASSVYSASPDGFKVFYTYLDELGADAAGHPELREPAEGNAPSSPPRRSPSSRRAARPTRSRSGCGTAAGSSRSAARRASCSTRWASAAARTAPPLPRRCKPLFPGAYADGDRRRSGPGPTACSLDASAWVAHFKDFGGQVLVSRQVGEGEVVWLAGPWPLSNAGIGAADNGRLAVQLATAGGRPVYFDEYHHGFVHEARLLGPARGRRTVGACCCSARRSRSRSRGWSRRLGPPIPEVAEPAARARRVHRPARGAVPQGGRARGGAGVARGRAHPRARAHGTARSTPGSRATPGARAALEASRDAARARERSPRTHSSTAARGLAPRETGGRGTDG